MKYQVVKNNKTGARLLSLHSTLDEAHTALKQLGARFEGLSYYGGFPTFKDEKGKVYSIQGFVEGMNVVCSLPQKEIEAYTF